MNEVKYKKKDGTFIQSFNKQVPENFTGYKISKDYNKISSIREYLNSHEIGNIKFRPTKIPVVFTVSYENGYRETRYSNGNIQHAFNRNSDGMMYGESRTYDSGGVLVGRTYHYEHKNVTEDIKSFIGYTGGDMNFVDYQFGEDEIFNIYMRYGSKFKFFNEYRIDKSIIDDIAKFCIE